MYVPPQFLIIGPFTIYFYSLFILLGIVLGFLLARLEARRFRISGEDLLISLFCAVIPGFIGARFYHVIDHWSTYSADPGAALAVWNGGLAILGGLAGGLLGLWLFWLVKWDTNWSGHPADRRIPFLRLLDIYVPSVLLAQAIGRFGNWTNQEAFGPPTDAPWGIFVEPSRRPELFPDAERFHPTFFYEAAFDLVGLAALLVLRPRLRDKPGAVLGAYLAIYGTGRFLVEFFRFDTAQVAGIAVAHLIAAMLVFAGVWLLTRKQTVAA